MPVTVTVTIPVVAKVQDSVDLPEPPLTLVGVRVHASLSAERATSPVKALRGDMVIVDIPAVPTAMLAAVGLAEIVKSGRPVTVYVTSAE